MLLQTRPRSERLFRPPLSPAALILLCAVSRQNFHGNLLRRPGERVRKKEREEEPRLVNARPRRNRAGMDLPFYNGYLRPFARFNGRRRAAPRCFVLFESVLPRLFPRIKRKCGRGLPALFSSGIEKIFWFREEKEFIFSTSSSLLGLHEECTLCWRSRDYGE